MAGLAPASLPPVRATVVRSILIDAAQVTVGAARRTRAGVLLERAVTCFRRVLLTRYTALFTALEREDVHTIVAGVSLPNEASISLHERFGFRPVGVFRAVGRKFDKCWDVCVVRALIAAQPLSAGAV
jgi:hypothetical protein